MDTGGDRKVRAVVSDWNADAGQVGVDVDCLAKHARAAGRVATLPARTLGTLDSIAVD
jgi:hypothetical protein